MITPILAFIIGTIIGFFLYLIIHIKTSKKNIDMLTKIDEYTVEEDIKEQLNKKKIIL
jgi:prepilin signal peptidase PulO-like enzyme (type II secretory pathway)